MNVDELLVSQPDHGEQALEIADTLVRSGAVDIIVIDSVAALVPKAEIEGEMGDSHVGLQARLMSQALRKLTGSVARSRAMVIFINQLRMKIGVMFGSPETTTGGNALKFYASVRLDIRRIGEETAAQVQEVETTQVLAANEVILDIRSSDERDEKPLVVEGREIMHIPFFKLATAFGDLPKEKTYLLYCDRGVMSKLQALYLKEQGFNNIKVYRLN